MRFIFWPVRAFLRRHFVIVAVSFFAAVFLKPGAAQTEITTPPPVVVRQSVPKVIAAHAPKMATESLGMRSGRFFLHWYRVQSRATLAVWETRGKHRWRLVRATSLPDGAYLPDEMPFYPQWGGPITYHRPDGTKTETAPATSETDWLCPSKRTGPIVIAGDGNCASFFVFPQGFDGPVIVYTGGSGDAGWSCSYYALGPADVLGNRILVGRYHWDTMDEGDDTDWIRYWTGAGWDNKGQEFTEHYQSDFGTSDQTLPAPAAVSVSFVSLASDTAALCSTSLFGVLVFAAGAIAVLIVSANGAETSGKAKPRALPRMLLAYALTCVALAYLADKSGSVAGGLVVNGCVALLTLLCVKNSVKRLRAYYGSAFAHADTPNS